jgi:predicted acyl esterase
VENDPAMRLYLMDSGPPCDWYEERPGRWIAEPQWPSANIATRRLHLAADGALASETSSLQAIEVASPQDCGMSGGEYCAMSLGPELPGDQRGDDAKSVCFDTGPLEKPLDIVGAPVIRLKLAADRPSAMVAVRLCDVQPDGASTRITYGVLNLTHRNGHEFPQGLVPGDTIDISLKLDDIAYGVAPGNRLRVAISSTYWPLVWPSPEKVTLTLHEGCLDLPVRPSGSGDEISLAQPESATPWEVETLREGSNSRTVERDADTGAVSLVIIDDFGQSRDKDHGLVEGSIVRERWTIHPDDPLSASGRTHWTATLSRDDWSLRTETFSEMRSDVKNFYLKGRIEAYEGEKCVFERDFEDRISRNHI